MNDSWHDNGNIWRPNRPEMGGDPHSYYQSTKRKKKSHNSYIPYEDRPRDKEQTESKNVLVRRTNKNYDSDAFASFEEQIEAKKQEHMKQTKLEQNQLQESLHNQINRQRQYLEEKDHIFSTNLNDHKNSQLSATVLPYNDSSLANNRHSKFSQSVQRAATQGCAFLSPDAINATVHTSPTNAGINGNLTRILQRPSNGDNTVVMTGPTTNESHVNSHPYNGFRNLATTSLTQPLTNTNTPAILKEFEKLSLQDNNNSGVAKKHVQISLENKDNNEIGANENDMKLIARATKSWADLDEMASSEDNQSNKGDRDVNNQNHGINNNEQVSLQFHKDENGKNVDEERYENDQDQYDDQDYDNIQENEFQEHKNYNPQHIFTTQDVRSGDLKKKGRGFQGQYRDGNSTTSYQSRRNRERNNTNRHTDGRGAMTRDRGSYDYNSYENQYDEYYDHYGYSDYNSSNSKHDNGQYRYRKPRKEHSHNVDTGEYSTFNVGDRRNSREPRYSEHKHYSSTNSNQFQNRNRERYQNHGRRRRGGGDDHTNTSTGLYTSTYENEVPNHVRGKRSGYSYTQHKNLGY